MSQKEPEQNALSVDAEKFERRTSTDAVSRDATPVPASTHYITGWRIHAITVGLIVTLFIAMVEALIASTAIIAITDDLGGYEKSSWVFTAYLLTFCGFQMVYGKLSDIIGRKFTILSALFLFTVFSGLCGASQTLDQLIMFRWVQGIGGCGIVSIVHFVFFELLPPTKWAANMGMVTVVMALALTIGPLIGGAIASTHQWRWIFLFNVPIGTAAFLILFLTFPTRLSNEACAANPKFTFSTVFSSKSLSKIDGVGFTFLLGFCVLLVTGLQEAALGYAWTSGKVLALLLCALAFLVPFFAWSFYVTTKRNSPEPVFPWRFLQSRIRVGMLLNTFFVGYVQFVCLVQVPQRFITVNGLSPISAGVRLIPFEVLAPTGACIAAILMDKPKVPPTYIFLAGAILQTVGVTLWATTVPSSTRIDTAQYGFQVLTGLGVGFVNSALILFVPYAMEKQDLATGSSAISQFRYLGGLVGIAVASSISTPYLRTHLSEVLPLDTVAAILKNTDIIKHLDNGSLETVRVIFAKGYNLQMTMLIGLAAAQIPATALMWNTQKLNKKSH